MAKFRIHSSIFLERDTTAKKTVYGGLDLRTKHGDRVYITSMLMNKIAKEMGYKQL